MRTEMTFGRRILFFLALVGPGIITGSVDNDAGGITTYAVAGATYGYNLLWTLIPSGVVLFIVQEMNARMGIVTGKGLADLIRENAGVKITFLIFVGLLIADIGNTMTEFAGVAGSMQVFHVSKYISIPLTALVVWILVVKGNYSFAERIFLIFSLALLSYIVSALMGKPQWGAIGTSIVHPTISTNFNYISTVIGIVGTTIAPWMQFYMQSAVIEKGLKIRDYKYTLIDVLVGCLATVVVAFFIIVATGATLYHNDHGTVINDAKDAAIALKPMAGAFASQVFAFGLYIASIFSATILPVATAFYVCEAFGFEAGIEKKWKEAPQFYVLYTIILVLAAAIIMIPDAPLIGITLWSQRINGILLPVVLIAMMLLVNNTRVMGKYVNKRWNNIIGWLTIAILVVLSIVLLVMSVG
ncbi:Nramp family divalent metal transporter (plasmid) [Alicyclobacillus fastidiosus]|uniref:Nramp family divalent metal transporter n=1 Tax=Alicyclobacillus fastidiosus TaxID=392011 RepID=A0ABY6ZQ02_9BACL|nr:Nramp family divalent metal transporter [Alicyclobacillus fastidiosus]WAH44935.1 Nramp family divalent metal transporter [Alicyclobacillus fastidiosus]GMA65588.1 Mn transporter [Alicyclobacillus fastidiosus]GMA65704.1 Mn transporter [Alicyclobacillus fastidiosus]